MIDNADLAKVARDLAAKIAKDEETKRLFKEAMTEWLDHKYAEFGKWTLQGLAAMAFGALIVFIMWTQGYHI